MLIRSGKTVTVSSFRDLLRRFGETYPPQMRYTGGESPRAFKAWQARFRARLRTLRGPLPPRGDPRIESLGRQDMGDHIREHVTIRSILDTRVPAYVLIPKGSTARSRPGVLAFHGHIPGGKELIAGVSPAPRPGMPDDYGLAAVQAGFVTLCPDEWGWGEREERGFDFRNADMCDARFKAAQMYGLSLLSIMLADAEACLGALMARPEVDPKRVGAIGNSLGGRMSMWLAALDTRVRCVVCAGCLDRFRERSLDLGSCGAQFLPGLLRWGDAEELFSLIAPRPLLILSGTRDARIPPEESQPMKDTITRAYRILGAEGRLLLHDFDGGHYLPPAPALDFLRKHFR